MRFTIFLLLLTLFTSFNCGQISYSNAQPQRLFDKISKIVSLKKGEFVLVANLNPEDCDKCKKIIFKHYNSVNYLFKKARVKLVGILPGVREADLVTFKQKSDWSYPLILGNGATNSELGLSSSTIIGLMTYDGKALASINSDSFLSGNTEPIITALTDYLKKTKH